MAASLHHLAPAAATPIIVRLGANNAFIGACMDFDALIANMQAARVLHFGGDGGTERNWSDVASVMEFNRQVRDALAFITGTTD